MNENTLTLNGITERRSEVAELIEKAAIHYTTFTERTATYPHTLDPQGEATAGLLYAALGLSNEVGELAEHIVAMEGEDPISASRSAGYRKLWDELGDCQWYVSRVACEAPITISFPEIVVRAAALYYGPDSSRRDMISGAALQARLSAHAGRVTGVIKKMLRDGTTWTHEKRLAKIEELEVHLIEFVARSFQFAHRTAPVFECDGGYIGLLSANIRKLEGRVERGTLHGDGENR